MGGWDIELVCYPCVNLTISYITININVWSAIHSCVGLLLYSTRRELRIFSILFRCPKNDLSLPIYLLRVIEGLSWRMLRHSPLDVLLIG